MAKAVEKTGENGAGGTHWRVGGASFCCPQTKYFGSRKYNYRIFSINLHTEI